MIRDRINQFLTFAFSQIRFSRGGVLLGREAGAGNGQEIIIGSGLTLAGGTLSAEGGVLTTEQTLTDGQQLQARENIGAVGTALEITTILQGEEADPTRIGAEYMPEVMDVDGVTFSDTSTVEMPVGTVGLKDGRLAIHDNATAGGSWVEGLILRGGASYDPSISADLLGVTRIIALAEVDIPLAMFTTSETAKMHFVGKAFIQSSLASYAPATNPRLVFYFSTANAVELADPKGVGIEIASAAAPEPYTLVDLNELLQVTTTASTVRLSGQTAALFSRMRKISSGNVVTDSNIAITTLQTGGSNSYRAGLRSPYATLRCALVLPPDAATADATGQIFASVDIRIQRTAALV